VLDVSVLPSRLAEAVRYLPRLDPVGVLFDAHAVRGTVALAGWPADAIRSWRDRIHALGGALSVLRAPVGSDVASVSSRGSADERRLASRIAAVFDPEGVLWRNAR
jgi:hypothetical protein